MTKTYGVLYQLSHIFFNSQNREKNKTPLLFITVLFFSKERETDFYLIITFFFEEHETHFYLLVGLSGPHAN